MDDKASKFWKEDAVATIENMLLAIPPVGNPAVQPRQARKKHLSEIVYYDRFAKNSCLSATAGSGVPHPA